MGYKAEKGGNTYGESGGFQITQSSVGVDYITVIDSGEKNDGTYTRAGAVFVGNDFSNYTIPTIQIEEDSFIIASHYADRIKAQPITDTYINGTLLGRVLVVEDEDSEVIGLDIVQEFTGIIELPSDYPFRITDRTSGETQKIRISGGDFVLNNSSKTLSQTDLNVTTSCSVYIETSTDGSTTVKVGVYPDFDEDIAYILIGFAHVYQNKITRIEQYIKGFFEYNQNTYDGPTIDSGYFSVIDNGSTVKIQDRIMNDIAGILRIGKVMVTVASESFTKAGGLFIYVQIKKEITGYTAVLKSGAPDAMDYEAGIIKLLVCRMADNLTIVRESVDRIIDIYAFVGTTDTYGSGYFSVIEDGDDIVIRDKLNESIAGIIQIDNNMITIASASHAKGEGLYAYIEISRPSSGITSSSSSSGGAYISPGYSGIVKFGTSTDMVYVEGKTKLLVCRIDEDNNIVQESVDRVINLNPYVGMFKVVNTSDDYDQKLKIIDSFVQPIPASATIAGDALINNKLFQDISSDEIVVSEECFIYLESEAGLTEPDLPTFEVYTIKQDYEENFSRTLISRVFFDLELGVITKFSQEVFGTITGTIDGACE